MDGSNLRLIVLLAILILLTSCATTLNRKTYLVNFSSSGNGDKIEVNKKTYALPARVSIKRSKEDLVVKLVTDTDTVDYTIQSAPNPQFLFYNLLGFSVAPAAYLIDLTNQKRFYYGRAIRLSLQDSARIITPPIRRRFENYLHTQYPSGKGEMSVLLTHSGINNFYFRPEGETAKAVTGFFGLSAGVSYYYTNTRSFALNIHGITDLETPIPVPIDYDGYYESMNSAYVTLTNHHKFNRLHLGYGVSFALNSLSKNYSGRFGAPPPGQEPFDKVNKSFGATLNGCYYLSRKIFVGAIYTPSIFRISPTTKFHYEHIISISGGIKLDVAKGKGGKE